MRGGIKLVEITFTVPDAPMVITKLGGADFTVGAGDHVTVTCESLMRSCQLVK